MNLIELAERGLIPDTLIRTGIRRLLARRLRTVSTGGDGVRLDHTSTFARELRGSPLAVATGAANDQHYEVAAGFFAHVLGPRLKYSSCYFTNPQTSLADAEEEMLSLTCARAEVEDGMRILELGCGWGSLTLWMAEHFPNSEITAVSNSRSQREFIEARTSKYGLDNVCVITADIRDFETEQVFDRVVSVEMFEHMRNYQLLLQRVSTWLTPEGKAFVHIFCHRDTPYLFETEGPDNWMGRHFFTGGMMPSEDLFSHFGDDLAIESHWRVGGWHYWKTCEAWLSNLDRRRAAILQLFCQDLSVNEAKRHLQRWRIFFMACAELFRYRDGNEWFVAHYRFRNRLAHASNSHEVQRHEVGRDSVTN